MLLFSHLTYRAGQKVVGVLLLPKALHAKSVQFLDSMRRFANLSFNYHVGITGLSITAELITGGAAYLLAIALELPLDFVTVVWLRALSFVISMLPITLNGLGLREGSFLVLLGPYGITPDAAVAYSLLLFGTQVFIGLVGGLIELTALWRAPKRSSRRHKPLSWSQRQNSASG